MAVQSLELDTRAGLDTNRLDPQRISDQTFQNVWARLQKLHLKHIARLKQNSEDFMMTPLTHALHLRSLSFQVLFRRSEEFLHRYIDCA